jgi:hypothetical protein
MAARGHRQVDADAGCRAIGETRCQRVARSGTEVGDGGVVGQLPGCESLPHGLKQRRPNSGGKQARPSLDNRTCVTRGQRSAVLRLEKIEVAAVRDVVRVSARADISAVASVQRQTAITDSASEDWGDRPPSRLRRYGGQPSPALMRKVGGRRGDRTRGLRIANAALSQLS